MNTKDNINLELLQLERPLIAYPLCFDDIMKTCLERDGIPHEDAFGYCRLIAYDKDKAWGERLSFPYLGYSKYLKLGVEVRKEKVEDFEKSIKTIQEEMKTGWVFLHYDGYFCPWDNLQKLRKWHTAHSVILTSVNPKKKYVIVSDAFYLQSYRKVSFSKLKRACKFYITLKTSGYNKKSAESIHEEQAEDKQNASGALQSFYSDFVSATENEVPQEVFSADWIKEWEKAFMTRHYLWLFYRRLYHTTGNSKYSALAGAYFVALQDWKECVVHSHKGARRKDKLPLCKRFADTLLRVIEHEKHAEDLIAENKKADICLLSASSDVGKGRAVQWYIFEFYNARACKLNRKDMCQADITGEGEYILANKYIFRRITVGSVEYEVFLGAEKDHIRCEGQVLTPPHGKWKGISMLVCSEWGRSQLLLKIQGQKREYITDFIANDFSFIGPNAVRVGSTYLVGEKKDVRLQKNVYFQSITFRLPEEDVIHAIVLPQCPSLHIFGVTLWE